MERSAGFAISVSSQDRVEENARERFSLKYGDPKDRKSAMKSGFVNAEGAITTKGWEQLNVDIERLERNSLSWLKEKFNSVSDEGYDRHEDLVGSFWFDTSNPKQAELISTGVDERIDMVDSSYGDLANSVWKGVSDFGGGVLDGQINFFDVDADATEEIEETLEASKKRARSRKKRG